MALKRGSHSGSADVSDISKMESNMESPMNAQKNGPEEGPQAPSGLPDFVPSDPLGICPGDMKSGHTK